MARFVHHGSVASRRDPIAAHEFRICHRIPAVAWALLAPPPDLYGRFSVRAICLAISPSRLARRSRSMSHFFAEAGALQERVKHFQREAPLPFGHLNGAVDDKSDAQARGDFGGRRFRRQVHDRRCWQHVQAL